MNSNQEIFRALDTCLLKPFPPSKEQLHQLEEALMILSGRYYLAVQFLMDSRDSKKKSSEPLVTGDDMTEQLVTFLRKQTASKTPADLKAYADYLDRLNASLYKDDARQVFSGANIARLQRLTVTFGSAFKAVSDKLDLKEQKSSRTEMPVVAAMDDFTLSADLALSAYHVQNAANSGEEYDLTKRGLGNLVQGQLSDIGKKALCSRLIDRYIDRVSIHTENFGVNGDFARNFETDFLQNSNLATHQPDIHKIYQTLNKFYLGNPPQKELLAFVLSSEFADFTTRQQRMFVKAMQEKFKGLPCYFHLYAQEEDQGKFERIIVFIRSNEFSKLTQQEQRNFQLTMQKRFPEIPKVTWINALYLERLPSFVKSMEFMLSKDFCELTLNEQEKFQVDIRKKIPRMPKNAWLRALYYDTFKFRSNFTWLKAAELLFKLPALLFRLVTGIFGVFLLSFPNKSDTPVEKILKGLSMAVFCPIRALNFYDKNWEKCASLVFTGAFWGGVLLVGVGWFGHPLMSDFGSKFDFIWDTTKSTLLTSGIPQAQLVSMFGLVFLLASVGAAYLCGMYLEQQYAPKTSNTSARPTPGGSSYPGRTHNPSPLVRILSGSHSPIPIPKDEKKHTQTSSPPPKISLQIEAPHQTSISHLSPTSTSGLV